MGDRLERLLVLRDHLTAAVEAGPTPRDLAALSARLADVLAQIEACEKAAPESKGTALDELTRRRQSKQA